MTRSASRAANSFVVMSRQARRGSVVMRPIIAGTTVGPRSTMRRPRRRWSTTGILGRCRHDSPMPWRRKERSADDGRRRGRGAAMVHRRGARALGVSPGFVFLPATDRYWLGGGRVPVALLAHPLAGIETDGDELGLVDIEVAGSTVARIVPSGETPMSGAVVQLDGGQVWPGFVDVHTHLDKGHTWQRAPNPDGTF